jgi:putative FmdB family regulatory protein
MPIYVYQCETCGLTFERRQRMTEPSLEDCPECEGHVHRVIQPVGIVFKGSGFYVTDNRTKSSTALPGKKDSDADSSSSGDSSSSTSSSEGDGGGSKESGASAAEPKKAKSTGGTD